MGFFSKKKPVGLVDGVKNRREGLIYISSSDYDGKSYSIRSDKTGYNAIFEVKEIYNDKQLSKVEIVNIPYNICKRGDKITEYFNPWVDTTKIHWLSPSIPVDRDNKLSEILK